MASDLILLDTSAWLCFFQAKPGHAGQDLVKKLLMEQRVATTPPIILELLEGVDLKAAEELLAELGVLPSLPVTEATWQNSFKLASQLRQASGGKRFPFSDLLIACVAMEHQCPVLHADPHFDEIARHSGLAVQRLTQEKMAA